MVPLKGNTDDLENLEMVTSKNLTSAIIFQPLN